MQTQAISYTLLNKICLYDPRVTLNNIRYIYMIVSASRFMILHTRQLGTMKDLYRTQVNLPNEIIYVTSLIMKRSLKYSLTRLSSHYIIRIPVSHNIVTFYL